MEFFYLAYQYGKPGRDPWKKPTALIVPLNLVFSVAAMFYLVTPVEAVETKTVVDEQGQVQTFEVSKKEYQKSIEAYEQALAVKKDYLPALIGLGNAQKAIQLYSQAEESYDRALAINPNYHDAWYGKGSVAEYLRQYPTAKEYYQKAFELKPDWEAVIKALERVDRKLGI